MCLLCIILRTRVEIHCSLLYCIVQMLQHLAKLDYELVLRETHQCLRPIVHADQVQQSTHFLCLSYSVSYKYFRLTFSMFCFQVLSIEDLQIGWCLLTTVTNTRSVTLAVNQNCIYFLFQFVCSWKTALLVSKCAKNYTWPCWIKWLSYFPLYCNKHPSEMDHCAMLLLRYINSKSGLKSDLFHVVVDVIHLSLQVCLQVFQLLSREIAALVWDKEHRGPTVQTILQALLEIILGKVFLSRISSLVEIF